MGKAMEKVRIEYQALWKAIEIFFREKGENWAFLREYVYFETFNYHEPSRKGTARGDKVGFPKNKHHASILVAITKWKLKDIAKMSEVSYGLLRKWKTESDFMEAVNLQRAKFVSSIVQRIRERFETGKEEYQKWLDGLAGNSPWEIGKDEPLDPMERVMVDANQFNDAVMDLLFFKAKEILEKGVDWGDDPISRVIVGGGIFNIVTWGKHRHLSPMHPLLVRFNVIHAMDLLKEPGPLSERDRKEVLAALSLAERTLKAISEEK